MWIVRAGKDAFLIDDFNLTPVELFDKEQDDFGELNVILEKLEKELVTFYDNEFIILDAKYYKLKFNEKYLSGQPGLESITKQYLYELAFNDFIDTHKFKGVKNAFLFPTYENEVENKGFVELEILHDLGLENIQVIMLPASDVNQNYLDNKKISISYLDLQI